MGDSWNEIEGVDGAERILRSALQCRADEIHLSADSDGATIFFASKERLEFFDHIKTRCRDVVREYFRRLAGVESFDELPAHGYGVFIHEDATVNLDIQLVRGILEVDVIVRLDWQSGGE